MVLGFKQFFDKQKTQPTYFREKIWQSVGLVLWDHGVDTPDRIRYQLRKDVAPVYKPKLHTIREGNRWEAGDLIHMAYGIRTKDYCQFNKGIPELERVKSVQKLEIVYGGNYDGFSAVIIAVDEKVLNQQQRVQLVINDGFDSLDAFFNWFNKDFEGQIVHWTELRY